MTGKRPVAVLVMAILNIVFGSLSLLGILCCGGFGAIMLGVLSKAPGAGGQPNPLKEMIDTLPQHVPGFYAIMIAVIAVTLITHIAQLASGIGLLKMRTWARWLSIIYACVTILTTIVGTIFNLTYVQPGMQRWNEDNQARLAKRPGVVAVQQPNSQAVNIGSVVVGVAFSTAYAIALLIVMFHPKVRAAFAGVPLPSQNETGDSLEDGYGDDRDWQPGTDEERNT